MRFFILCFTLLVCSFDLHSLQENDLLLRVAGINNDNELLIILQKYGTKQDTPAINNALEANDIKAAIILLEYGVNVNRRGPKKEGVLYGSKYILYNDGQTALEIAIAKNMLSIIPILLEKGANPHSIRKLQFETKTVKNIEMVNANYESTTAISDAIGSNQLEVIVLLHNYRVSMNMTCIGLGYTPIAYTPLQYALSFNHHDIAGFLISIEANLDSEN